MPIISAKSAQLPTPALALTFKAPAATQTVHMGSGPISAGGTNTWLIQSKNMVTRVMVTWQWLS